MAKKETKVQKDDKFPRTLYKAGGSIMWGKSKMYSSVLVENEEEMKAAIANGYIDDFSKAIFGEVKEEPVEEADDMDDF